MIPDLKNWLQMVTFGATLTGVFALTLIWVFGLQPMFGADTVYSSGDKWLQVFGVLIISTIALIVPMAAMSERSAKESRQQIIEDYLRISRDMAGISEATLIEALDTIPAGFVVYDSDDRLIRCNSKFREIYGYSLAETTPGVTQVQLAQLDEKRGVRILGESTDTFIRSRLEYRSQFVGEQLIELPDGRLISANERRLARGGFVSIQTDITELTETRSRLQKSEQILLDAIEGLDEGFVFYDENDQLVIANSTYKRMYPAQNEISPGISFEDAIKLSVYSGEVPAAFGREDEWIAERLAQHHSKGGISEQILSDGRWVKVSERETADGGRVGIRTDISELKESQTRAEAANRAKSSFLAHMSHELRTPLNSVIGYSDMIRQETFGPVGDPVYGEYLDNIYNSGALLLALINDILDISRVEIGEMEANPEKVDPRQAIATCVDMIKPKASAKNLEIEVVPATFNARLYIDARHLQQILVNLLNNAVKFTGPNGKISIHLNDHGEDGVKLQIVDTGCGISEDEISKVFKPFSQVGDAFSNSNEGTGLGLYLVKNLASLNDAHVHLESELDVGTSVTITIPTIRIIY